MSKEKEEEEKADRHVRFMNEENETNRSVDYEVSSVRVTVSKIQENDEKEEAVQAVPKPSGFNFDDLEDMGDMMDSDLDNEYGSNLSGKNFKI